MAWLASSRTAPSPARSTRSPAAWCARFFIGLTPGYYNPTLTVEDVRDHLTEIRDEDGYIVPDGPNDELQKIFQTVTGQQA